MTTFPQSLRPLFHRDEIMRCKQNAGIKDSMQMTITSVSEAEKLRCIRYLVAEKAFSIGLV
jgi:hypothetical protein